MKDRTTVAAQLMLVAAIKARLAQVEQQLRLDAGELMPNVGTVEPVMLPSNGETVGKVRRDAGATRVSLDWEKVTRWARKKYPSVVTMRRKITYELHPVWAQRMQDASTKAGVGVDPDSGEILPEHLWSASKGASHITVVPTKDRADLLVSYLGEAMEMAGRLLDSHQPKEIDQP
jgi:hypothetical protein